MRPSLVLQVTMADFLEALDEVKPAFGAVIESLESYRLHGEGRLGACACPARWAKTAATPRSGAGANALFRSHASMPRGQVVRVIMLS